MLINGIQSTTIKATDRGLAYGDGLFSTLKVELGKVQLWDFHLQRLQLGAQRLFFPDVNWAALENEVELLAETLIDKPQAVLKIILTRGTGGRGYSSHGCNEPLRILSVHDFPGFYKQWQSEGIALILCQQRLAINPSLAGLKTLNRLEQVLIKHELEIHQAVEGIVCDSDGFVIEACTANVFVYLNQQWLTPKLDRSGVKGVKRRQVIELAKQANIIIKEVKLTVDNLMNADVVCLTNALMDLVPVKQFQSHCYDQSAFLYIDRLRELLRKGDVQ